MPCAEHNEQEQEQSADGGRAHHPQVQPCGQAREHHVDFHYSSTPHGLIPWCPVNFKKKFYMDVLEKVP